jgi:hypothetical protein
MQPLGRDSGDHASTGSRDNDRPCATTRQPNNRTCPPQLPQRNRSFLRHRPRRPRQPFAHRPAHSREDLVSALRSGGYNLYFRHAATDPVPDDTDPSYFPIAARSEPIRRTDTIGGDRRGHRKLGIPVGRVLSVPSAALDTARLAFGKAMVEPARKPRDRKQ